MKTTLSAFTILLFVFTQTISVFSKSISSEDDEFYFPNEAVEPKTKPSIKPKTNAINFVPDVNATLCMGRKICNFVDNYPTDHIEKLFKLNKTNYDDLLGEDKMDVKIGSRINAMENGEAMCTSKTFIEEPKVGQNKDNEWFFLVNQGPYKQGVQVEVCMNELEQCAMSDNFIMKTECRQRYILRKMLALDSNGELKPETIQLPSCCMCYVTGVK